MIREEVVHFPQLLLISITLNIGAAQTAVRQVDGSLRPKRNFESFDAPKINGSTDAALEVAAGSKLLLICHSSQQTQWKLPDSSRPKFVKQQQIQRSDGYFENSLQLWNLIFSDTASYTCSKSQKTSSGVKDENGSGASKDASATMYVFVQDSINSNLLFHGHHGIVTLKSSGGYVDCRITHPAAAVSIFWLSPSGIVNLTDIGFYDPRRGFHWTESSLQKLPDAFRKKSAPPQKLQCKAAVDSLADEETFLFMIMPSYPLKKPILVLKPPHAYFGGNLVLDCIGQFEEAPKRPGIWCNWTTPSTLNDNKHRVNISEMTLQGASGTKRKLTISSLQLSDSGLYSCNCGDYTTGSEFESVSTFINVSKTKGRLVIKHFGPQDIAEISGGGAVNFSIVYNAWPPDQAVITWKHSQTRIINGTLKEVSLDLTKSGDRITKVIPKRPQQDTGDVEAQLRVTEASLLDSGTYTVLLKADDVEESRDFQLRVKSALSVDIQSSGNSRFLELGQRFHVICVSNGFPLGNMELLRKQCRITEDCHWHKLKSSEKQQQLSDATFERALNFTMEATMTGTFKCSATNQVSAAPVQQNLEYIVTDIKDADANQGLIVEALPASSSICYEGDHLTLLCKVQKFDYAMQKWIRTLETGENLTVAEKDGPVPGYDSTFDRSSSPFSDRFQLIFQQLRLEYSGMYYCSARQRNNIIPSFRGYNLKVHKVILPKIIPNQTTHLGQLGQLPLKLTANYSQPLLVPCQTHGDPSPSISWYKNGKPVTASDKSQHERNLEFESIVKEDAGDYTCVAESRFGKDEWNFTLEVEGGPAVQQNALVYLLLILACFGLIGLVISVALLRWQHKTKVALLNQLHTQLMATTNSQKQLKLDPSIPIQQQTENLPYDEKFELPSGCIDLRKVIGQGQFGKVYHAVAYLEGIAEPVQVAVKVPRDGMNVEHQKALLSELRIMIYLGCHVNVLGLVGAITRNMSKGDLFVVTEYCKYTSLLEFLHRRRNLFVDEIVRLNSTELRANNSNDNDGYLAPKPLRITYRSQQDPTWSDQLMSDQAASGFICTTDLLSFCYQTSNGMAFLASKNLIHRDLAARNVLLADGFVVKICDFGLARNDDTYQTKKSLHVPLPVRWMALESIKFRQHTEKSDVWSFGVLLWEVFTLGEVPYPQANFDENFVHMLENGHRLQQSAYCPDDVYVLMRRCWAEDPDSRPNFVECKADLETQLGLCSTQKLEQVKRLLLAGSSGTGSNPQEASSSPRSLGIVTRNSCCDQSLENELNDYVRTPRFRKACADNDSVLHLRPTAEKSFCTAQNPAYFASADVPLSLELTERAAVPLMQDHSPVEKYRNTLAGLNMC